MIDYKPKIKFHGVIDCDCRYSASANITMLREKLHDICRTIRQHITHHDNDYSNRLGASLMYHLQCSKSDQVTSTVSDLCEHISTLKSPVPTLVQLADPKLLIETRRNLCHNGNLIFLPHDQIPAKSLLILNEGAILLQVHACLTKIKMKLANKIGMLTEKELKSILCSSLQEVMEPELAIKYLILTQFCTEVTTSHLISTRDQIHGETHYFFPNLVMATRPAKLWSDGTQKYTQLYTWCLKCTANYTPMQVHPHLIHPTYKM